MGVCAAYGHVSGPPDPVDIIQDLTPSSLFCYPTCYYALCCETIRFRMDTDYLKPSEMEFDANINYEYALKDAVMAHSAIESGTTLGASVPIP